jgi:antirestriction protein ArdC
MNTPRPTRPNGSHNRPERVDIHAVITDQIVAAIEAGAGTFKMPWHRDRGALFCPVNIASGKPYQGINILALWCAAEQRGYSAPIWGTFKQWLEAGYPVRKGEKSVTGVFYKDLHFTEEDASTGESVDRKVGMARAFPLFNCAQVEGYTPAIEAFTPTAFEVSARVEALIAASQANIVYGGDRAFYNHVEDRVQIPDRERFVGTDTMTPAEAFEATRLHELVHWSGAEPRLDREFGKRFGDKAYAFEELVAELGAAYLCTQLGVTPIARPDHAQYLAGWLAVMKEDKKAIFTAAGQAQRAATFLMGFAPPDPDSEPGDDPSPGDRPPAPGAMGAGQALQP